MLNCTIGDDEAIQELLNLKADVNIKRPEGKTCMHLAAHSGKLNCVKVPLVWVGLGCECFRISAAVLIICFQTLITPLVFNFIECRTSSSE